MLTHILGGQGDGAGVLASARGFAGVHGAVVSDVLDNPLLPVRYSERGVVLAGLDQVTDTDGQAVAAGRGHGIVDLAAPDPPGADAFVQRGGFVVGGDGDRLLAVSMGGDVLTRLLAVCKADARRYAHPRLLANWNDWFTFALGWQPEEFTRARAVWPKVQRMAVRLHATDARMTLGTDMSNPWIAPGISLHREMQLLAEAGVPVTQLLQAATVTAAEALGAGQRLGRIAPGFEADLLVLDANPLDDIRHTRHIHAVVLDGQFLATDALNQLKGE